MSLLINKIVLVKQYQILAILYPTSLANLVVEVGTRHSHQTLLKATYPLCLQQPRNRFANSKEYFASEGAPTTWKANTCAQIDWFPARCVARHFSRMLCRLVLSHYSEVIMGTMASQIIYLTIVYSNVYSGANQSSASLVFVREIH